MKTLSHYFLPGIIGVGFSLISTIAFLTLSSVFAAPTQNPPNGNPPWPPSASISANDVGSGTFSGDYVFDVGARPVFERGIIVGEDGTSNEAKIEFDTDSTPQLKIFSGLEVSGETWLADGLRVDESDTLLDGDVRIQGNLEVTGTNDLGPGTWCGLCGDDNNNVERCGGQNVCNGCPSGYTKKTLSAQIYGNNGADDWICIKN